MGDDATRFTGDIPGYYDRMLGPVLFAGYAEETARRAAVRTPSAVLETAAGTGRVTRALRDALPADTSLVATDLNDAMLAVARTRVSEAEARIEPADAQDLPFDDAAFDLVVCQFGVMFYPDLARSFDEVRRVLRPGGAYLFAVWGGLEENRYPRITDALVRERFPHDPPTFHTVPFSMGDPEPLAAAARAAGFVDHSVERIALAPPVASWPEFALGVVRGNPLAEQVEARGGSAAELVDAIGQALRAELGPEPAPLPMVAYLHTATL